MTDKTDNTAEETQERVISFVSSSDNATQTGSSGSSPARKPRRRKPRKPNVDLKCALCESGVDHVTYKDVYQLKKFTSARGKIIGAQRSGVCAKHQRQLTRAIKRARHVALMPYVAADA